ncbi:hypothetical protein F5Y14DRAFT_33601 [Nemania sp. NC0429]|nr:hypothetical protein F5Y14DRAFT_33601 [Nemania sp. NC0429]
MDYFFSGSKPHVPSRRPATEDGSLYFAYGSNLHLTQMANRCPASIFKGKGVLSGYRWQINERGVANVVKSSGDSVEGLVYLVNRKDEKALDRSEGVARGFYQKHILTISFEPHESFAGRQSFEVAQLIAQPDESSPSQAKAQEERDGTKTVNIKALVYVSENYTSDGIIRQEYILRTQKAMFDAEILGVSRSFVSKYVTPYLDERNEVIPASNHAEGGGQTLESHENDGSARAKAKRVKVVDKHEGQSSGRFRSHASEDKIGSLDLVDFHELERANRSPHADSGLEFPTDMLDAIRSTRSRALLPHDFKLTYVVVASEEDADSKPRFEILATSWDLELANALAIKHFRDACSRSFPGVTAEVRDHWAKPTDADSRPGGLSWKLDEDAYLRLDAAVPMSSRRITVQVIAQKLSARFGR